MKKVVLFFLLLSSLGLHADEFDKEYEELQTFLQKHGEYPPEGTTLESVHNKCYDNDWSNDCLGAITLQRNGMSGFITGAALGVCTAGIYPAACAVGAAASAPIQRAGLALAKVKHQVHVAKVLLLAIRGYRIMKAEYPSAAPSDFPAFLVELRAWINNSAEYTDAHGQTRKVDTVSIGWRVYSMATRFASSLAGK